jgi:hypothetical protein
MHNRYLDALGSLDLSNMNYHTQQIRTTFVGDPPEVVQHNSRRGMKTALHIVGPDVKCEVVEKT